MYTQWHMQLKKKKKSTYITTRINFMNVVLWEVNELQKDK